MTTLVCRALTVYARRGTTRPTSFRKPPVATTTATHGFCRRCKLSLNGGKGFTDHGQGVSRSAPKRTISELDDDLARIYREQERLSKRLKDNLDERLQLGADRPPATTRPAESSSSPLPPRLRRVSTVGVSDAKDTSPGSTVTGVEDSDTRDEQFAQRPASPIGTSDFPWIDPAPFRRSEGSDMSAQLSTSSSAIPPPPPESQDTEITDTQVLRDPASLPHGGDSLAHHDDQTSIGE